MNGREKKEARTIQAAPRILYVQILRYEPGRTCQSCRSLAAPPAESSRIRARRGPYLPILQVRRARPLSSPLQRSGLNRRAALLHRLLESVTVAALSRRHESGE